MDNITPERQILKEINRLDTDSGKKLPKTTDNNNINSGLLISDHNNDVNVTTSEIITNVKQQQSQNCEENNINNTSLGKSILPDILIAPTTPRQLTSEGSQQSSYRTPTNNNNNNDNNSTFSAVDNSGLHATVSLQQNSSNVQPDIQNDLNQSSDDESFMECRSFNDTTTLNDVNDLSIKKDNDDKHCLDSYDNNNVTTITTTDLETSTLNTTILSGERQQQQEQQQQTTFVDSTSTFVHNSDNNDNTEQTINTSSDYSNNNSVTSEPTVIFINNNNTITQQSEITSSNLNNSNNNNNDSVDENNIVDSPESNNNNNDLNLISVKQDDLNLKEIRNIKEKQENDVINRNYVVESSNNAITSTNNDNDLKSLEHDLETINFHTNNVMINDTCYSLNKTLDANDEHFKLAIDLELEFKRCESSLSITTPLSTERSFRGVDLIPSNEEINIKDLHIDLNELNVQDNQSNDYNIDENLSLSVTKSPSQYQLNISQTLSAAENIEENLNETASIDVNYVSDDCKSESCFNTTMTLEDPQQNDCVIPEINSETLSNDVDDNYFARNIFPVESSKSCESINSMPVESMDWEECGNDADVDVADNQRLSVRQDLFTDQISTEKGVPMMNAGNNSLPTNININCSKQNDREDVFMDNLNTDFDLTFKKPKTPTSIKSSPIVTSDVGCGDDFSLNEVKSGEMSFPFESGKSRSYGSNTDDFTTFPDDEFQSSNGLIFKQSDFDFLLTKGNNKVPDDRSSLLLQFDPLVGLRQFPQQQQQQRQLQQSQNINNKLFPSKLSPTTEETSFIDSGCSSSHISCVSNVTLNNDNSKNNYCELNLNETLPIGEQNNNNNNYQVELKTNQQQQQQYLNNKEEIKVSSVIKQEKTEEEEEEESRVNNNNNSSSYDSYIIGSSKILKTDKVVDKTSNHFNHNLKGHDNNTTMSVDCIQDMKVGNDVKSSFDNNMSAEQDEKQEYKMAELEKKIKNEVLKTEDIEKKLKESEIREETLLKRITEKDKCIAKLSGVMEAYEKAIAELISEKEQIGKNYENKCAELVGARDLNLQHLTSLETTFSDLNAKYERSKQKTAALLEAKELLIIEKQQNLENLRQQEQRYEKLKGHAMAQLEIANNKLDSLTKNHAQEITRLKALLKKEEVSKLSIKEQLQQKTRENEELVKICDELIGGSSSS